MATVGPYAYLEKFARETPDQFAVVNGPTRITFAKLHDMTSAIGSAMRAEGVRKGHVVLLKAGSPLWDYIFCIAALHEGVAVAVQTSPTYNRSMAADFAFSAFPIDGFPKANTVTIDATWLSRAEKSERLDPISYDEPNPMVRLLQTSGTTGEPKVLEYKFQDFTDIFAGANQETMEQVFCLLPFSIMAGSTIGLRSLKLGLPYLLPTGNRVDDLKMIEAYRCTTVIGSTGMIADIYADEAFAETTSKIKILRVAGSAIPRQMVQQLRQKSNVRIMNRYGSTEVGGVAGREVSLTDEDQLVGTLYPGVVIRIVDDQFNELPHGEIGRIAVQTPHMRQGYRNNSEATAKHFVDGFFYSGDEGYLTDSNQLFLVGREDERINAGGVKSDPAILDVAIRSISGIRDAAVFGFDRKDGIRAAAAVLVLEPGAEMSKLIEEINRDLGSKKPAAFIEVKAIPRNLMGKVQRLELEKMYSNDARKLAGG